MKATIDFDDILFRRLNLPRITAVELRGGFVLKLTFTDGAEREVDLSDSLEGPALAPLRDAVLGRDTPLGDRIRA